MLRSAVALAFASCLTLVTVGPTASPAAAADGNLTVTPVMTGLSNPWDLAFAPDGTMFVTERAGRIRVRVADGSTRQLSLDMGDLWASGETGLMGVEIDPDFASNRRIYSCQGTIDNDFTVQVVAWVVNAGYTAATRVSDPLVGGIDGRAGRHGGCQLRIDQSGTLWIGTGDAAFGPNPQSATSLAGKVLRVDRLTGAGLPGNPFFNEGGDRARIYTWGHRNLQGLAVRPGTGEMWSVEHGPDRDDEINRLVAGGNYGWDPVPGYNESVPMTDLVKFPNAVPALWSSGRPTVAISGAAFLPGSAWGSWQNALAVSALRDSRLRILFFDANGGFAGQVVPPELDRTHGRLRASEIGPGGVLFVTTDNGGGSDHVLAVAPAGEGYGLGAVAAPAQGLDLSARGVDGRVWVRSWTGSSWSDWTSLGGDVTSDPDVASWGGGRLDLVARGIDGAVWHRSRQGGTWSSWTSLGGVVTSGPAVVSSGAGRLDVFARGIDGAMWTRSLSDGSWSGWTSLGGQITSDPDAVSPGPSQLDVFARGVDGALWHRRWAAGVWQAWQLIGGQLSSGPGAAAWGPNRVDVFVRGTDGRMYQAVWNGPGWFGWYMGVGQLTSAPEAMSRGANSLDVFMRGNDGGLYQMSWTGAWWTPPLRLG